MQLLKNLIRLDQECVKSNFSNVYNFAKCGWIFTGVVKNAYPCYKLQISPLHRENLAVQKENVPRLLMSANQTNIAKMFTESLPVPSKQ